MLDQMEENHPTNVDVITEDEFGNLSNEESIQTNEYPDLDYVPEYPWLGQQGSLLDTGPMLLEQPSICDAANQEFLDDASKQNIPLEGLELSKYDSVNQHPLPRAKNYPSDIFVDPDFKLSDEDLTSDQSMSEVESDSQQLKYQGPQERLSSESDQARSNVRSRGKRGGRAGGSERGKGRPRQGRRGGVKGVKRGQRKPIEPSVEYKMLHSQATMAFIDHDYEEAEQLTLQAILVNPEMYTARFLLSEIHMARGDKDKAITALFHAAHTKPRDTQGWLKLAQLLLERDGGDRSSTLRDAIYCYGRIINVESANVEARYQRAALNRELGYAGRAAQEYEHLLKHLPHDTTVLRHLAEIYIELNDADRAVAHYDNSITYYREKEPCHVTSFTWSDVNICAELFGYQSQYEEAIMKLKSLSRWLLGRGDDSTWDEFDEDDREWDSDDLSRRMEIPGFRPGAYKKVAYGDGLPLELRLKLGVYRLKAIGSNIEEAMNHFKWLDPDDNQPGAKLFDYPDLFREAADALRVCGHYHESLRFYEPLQNVEGYTDASYFTNMALCYRAIGMKAEAKDCYQAIVDDDSSNVEARLNLARSYEDLGMLEQAGAYVLGLLSVSNQESNHPGIQAPFKDTNAISAPGSLSSTATMLMPRPQRQITKPRKSEREIREQLHTENALGLYLRVQDLTMAARNGNVDSRVQWMATARSLIQYFKSNKAFYPYDKHIKFLGFSKDARLGSLKSKAGQAVQQMQSLSGRLRLSSGEENNDTTVIPSDYLGIPFHAWLDIFLEYALMLAHGDDFNSAYEILSAAHDANIFFHSQDSMFLLHVCWFTCAMVANDGERLCNTARWFMKEYQFATDGYRLFSALNRLCESSNSWYNCGPSQKYVLRQLKAMDFSLVGDARNKTLFHERASYTTKDGNGNVIRAEGMDVALLVLYGHILYAGKSYSYALNYLLRAYALDPTNPMINLSLALSYLHYAIKRQSGNRHHLMTQGFAFLFTYYNIRQRADIASEMQEAEFNVARAYHMLGLTHLAFPYYQRCLALSKAVKTNRGSFTQDFAKEAAFSLQRLWAGNGGAKEALKVTERWLVL